MDVTREASAMLLKDDTIELIGSTDEIPDKWFRDADQVVDLEGKIVTPGFLMSHAHFVFYALIQDYINVSSMNMYFQEDYVPATTADEVLNRIENDVPDFRVGEWIVAIGYDPMLQSGPVISRQRLDEIAPNNPVYLGAQSGHSAYVNTRTIVDAGLGTVDSSDNIVPTDQVMLSELTDLNTGFIAEEDIVMLLPLLPLPSLPRAIELLDNTTHLLNSKGITTMGESAANGTINALYGLYIAAAEPNVRFSTYQSAAEPGLSIWNLASNYDPENVQAVTDQLDIDPVETQERLAKYLDANRIKIISDGSLQGYTALLRRPYSSPPFFDVDNPNTWRGVTSTTVEQMSQQILQTIQRGYQVAIHANGDAAIDNALTSIERALVQLPPDFPRKPIRIEHSTMLHPSQIDKMKQLGVNPSFLINHIYYYGDVFRDRIIGRRADSIDPTRSSIRKGVRFDLHSDAPVSPPDPLFMMWIATERLTNTGQELNCRERVSPFHALQGITSSSARNLALDDRGVLAPGKLADFVVLSDNPLVIPANEVEVLSTYVGGRQVYTQ